MNDATTLRKIASELRTEANKRDYDQKIKSTRVITAAVGITALRKLAGGRP